MCKMTRVTPATTTTTTTSHQHSYALVVLKPQEAGLGGAPSREQAQPRATALLSGGHPLSLLHL